MICNTLTFLVPTLRWVGILLTGRLLWHRRPQWAYWSSITIHLPYLVGVWPLGRISHLSRRRRIMETKKTIRLLWAALLSLSGVLPAVATDYQASDYLPLAVGNSWTYRHELYDIDGRYGDKIQWSAYMDQEFPQFTITVDRTEVIDGKTYYVISDMPANWPPAPPHFIAGKKLRWQGTHLMEYTGGGEQALYRFDGANKAGYEIVTDGVANRVTVRVFVDPVPWYAFEFHADAYGDGRQGCVFRAGYGYEQCTKNIYEDHIRFRNRVKALRAVLGGHTVEFEDALIPTSSSSSSWGQVKQSLFSHTTVERSDR